jgi:inhibitor of cysteine peptidase
MQIWTSTWRNALSAALAATFWSCAGTGDWVEQTPEPDVSAPTVRISGTVHYMDIEGGLYVIDAADGTKYNPVNLPDSFKSDGMEIEADIRRRDDLTSIAMVGPMIEVLRIRPRPGE